jgi:hypothetical protein
LKRTSFFFGFRASPSWKKEKSIGIFFWGRVAASSGKMEESDSKAD